MAERSVSIAEARAKLSGLVKEAEEGAAVRITRWGAPVAVLVSARRYQQLAHGRPSFGAALDDYLERVDIGGIGLDEGEFENLRGGDAGREPRW
jgi:prevent-host-death family protein